MTTPTATAPAIAAWLLGNDQSPSGGHSAIDSTARVRHGRSTSTSVFDHSLHAQATTSEAGASAAHAIVRAVPLRPRHHTATSSPRSTTIDASVNSSANHRTHGGFEFANRTTSR
jgi:hypothetical protein